MNRRRCQLHCCSSHQCIPELLLIIIPAPFIYSWWLYNEHFCLREQMLHVEAFYSFASSYSITSREALKGKFPNTALAVLSVVISVWANSQRFIYLSSVNASLRSGSQSITRHHANIFTHSFTLRADLELPILLPAYLQYGRWTHVKPENSV